MKKLIVLFVAVFLVAFVINANAGTLTVGNTDLTLGGGISASYNYMSDAKGEKGLKSNQDDDYFHNDTAIVHLFKDPTVDSPVGGHFAFGAFDVKLVTDGEPKSPTIGGHNFRTWLGYFSWMPLERFTVDAGLLWHKFGERPISIMNPHITRSVAFTAQPVAFAGARLGFDTPFLKVYAGMNDGSALGEAHGEKDGETDASGKTLEDDRAFEVGACANIAETFKVAVNYFDHDEGYNTVNASAGVDLGIVSARLEANFVNADTKNVVDVAGGPEAKDDSATTWALYAALNLTDNFKVPVRIELVDDNDSYIYRTSNPTASVYGYDGWNVTITPTFYPTGISFIRLEGVYAEDDNKVFRDSDGVNNKEDSRTSLMAEFGFLF